MGLDWSKYAFHSPSRRPFYPYMNYYTIRTYATIHPEWPIFLTAVRNTRNGMGEWNYLSNDFENESNQTLELFLRERDRMERLKKYQQEVKEKALRELDPARIETKSNEDLAKMIDSMDLLTDITKVSGVTRGLDFGLSRAVMKFVNEKNAPADAIAVISLHEEDGINVQEKKAVLRVASEWKKRNETGESEAAQNELKMLEKEYGFISRSYYDEKPRTHTEYLEMVSAVMYGDPEKELVEMDQKKQEDLRLRDEWVEKLSLNADENFLVYLSRESAKLKDANKAVFNQMAERIDGILIEMARRTDQPLSAVKQWLPHEMKKAILTGEIPNEHTLNERKRHLIFAAKAGVWEWYEGKEADAFEQKNLIRNEEIKTEIKGRVACRGKVSGTARVVLGSLDFAKLKQGDILVVSNTTPDFVQILGRATGLIAEEGGITAHVSVVSREFNIPCIVGIPNITKRIRDGDHVEVDAENGLIRILSTTTK